jgi:predicted RNA methylase
MYARFFAEHPNLFLPAGRVVDLGCGPGSKSVALSWALRGVTSKFWLVDRDPDWGAQLTSSVRSFPVEATVEATVGDFLEDFTADTFTPADTVMMLQVPYGDEFADRFADWFSLRGTIPSVWIASAEAADSVTAQLRRRIAEALGIKATFSTLSSVAMAFEVGGFSVTRFRLAAKTLWPLGNVDEQHWLLDFLLGTDGAVAALPKTNRDRLVALIRDEINARAIEWTLTDDVIVARRRGHD